MGSRNRRTKSGARMLFGLLLVGALAGAEALAKGFQSEEFDEAEVLVEINATDGDAGFQGMVDGEPWTSLRLRAPNWRLLFNFRLFGSAKEQGFTEFNWESAEPTFDVASLDDFLERFPEGEYLFTAKRLDKQGFLVSAAELTHDLPAGPVITSPEEGEGVPSGQDLVIEWNAVTTVFETDDPQGENTADLDSEIVRYIIVAEFEDEEAGIDETLNIDVQLLPGDEADTFSATIPGDSEGYKVEVGAVEESGNRTFTEVEICTDAPCPEEED